MSTLIIGGSFLLAVLALIVLALLLQGEEEEQEKIEEEVIAAPQEAEITRENPELLFSRENEQKKEDVVAPSVFTEETTEEAANVPRLQETKLSLRGISQGQIHELAVELHNAYQEAQLIEQRIDIITGIVEQLQSKVLDSDTRYKKGPATHQLPQAR